MEVFEVKVELGFQHLELLVDDRLHFLCVELRVVVLFFPFVIVGVVIIEHGLPFPIRVEDILLVNVDWDRLEVDTVEERLTLELLFVDCLEPPEELALARLDCTVEVCGVYPDQ